MTRNALTLVLLVAVSAGTALAFNYSGQEREQETRQERDVRREGQEREREVRRERPRVHPLAIALELQKKLELSEQQVAELLERWKVYRPAREKHTELIAKLRAQYEDSAGEKRQALGNRIESTVKEFNTWSEKLTHETFEIVGPDRTEIIRQTMREISGRREGERRRVHPLAMALEHNRELGLRDNQRAAMQEMWTEFKSVQGRVNDQLQELEREFARMRERGAGEQDLGAIQQKSRGLRQELGAYSENVAGRLYEILGSEKQQVLEQLMRGSRERGGERERAVDREREVRGDRQVQRETDVRSDRAVRRESDVRRDRPRIHPLGMALEMRQKLGLREEQVKHLQDMWNEYRAVMQEHGAMLAELERELATLRRELGQFDEEMAGAVYEALGPDQRDMLRNQMREFNQRTDRARVSDARPDRVLERGVDPGMRRVREVVRERDVQRDGGQEREFAQMVAELRKLVAAGEITGNQAEERIAKMRSRMEQGREGGRERDGGPETEYKRAVAELQAAVKSGRITGNQAEERIAKMRSRMEQGREGGQEREFEAYVAQLRKMVETGEITANEAEERIAATRRRMAEGRERGREGGQEREFAAGMEEIQAALKAGRITEGQAEEMMSAMRRRMEQGGREREVRREGEQRREGERDVPRKPKNPIGQHPMAYALEGRQKIGMTEEQYGTLRGAWLEIYGAGNEIGAGMRELDRHTAELREAGEWNDRSARRVNAEMEELKQHLEQLHGHASEILVDTLNKEQMNGLEELMNAAKNREGGERGLINPMSGHAIAWALELHEKLGLNEGQISRLRETYTGLRREGDGLNERQMELQQKLNELRESGKLTDGSEREFAAAMKNIGADREALQAKGSEVLADTLNREQIAALRKHIEENRKNDG